MRKVLVIGTGGTISCKNSGNGLSPALSVQELVKDIKAPVQICTDQLCNIDSTNMTPRHWEQLARVIRTRFDKFDGFVITHGTDTMAYAAASLACLIQNSRKPIVFTGSMKPMNAENSDAPKNLADAVAYAADEHVFGVKLAFGGKLFDGRSVSKQNSTEADAFDSLNSFPFSEKEYSGETKFYECLSDNVFVAKLIPGQTLVVPNGTRAVILESYGAGGVPDYLADSVKSLADSGIYVIIATQCAKGGTNIGKYEVGKNASENFPLIETGKLTIEYAVAKARWALAYSDNYDTFRKLFFID